MREMGEAAAQAARQVQALRIQLEGLYVQGRGVQGLLLSIREQLGQAVTPFWEWAKPGLVQFLQLAERAAWTLARLSELVFGRPQGAAASTAGPLQVIAQTAQAVEGQTAAVKKQAGALRETGKAAQKAARHLAKFDEINQLAKDSERMTGKEYVPGASLGALPGAGWLRPGSGGGMLGGGGDSETGWMQRQIPWLREFLRMAESLKALGTAIAQTFQQVWQAGRGEAVLGGINRLVRTLFLLIADVADGFTLAWNEGGRGQLLAQRLLDLFAAVAHMVASVGQALREAWNLGAGAEFAGHLLSIFSELVAAAGALAQNFERAWQQGETGRLLFSALLGLANHLLSAVHNMAQATAQWAQGLDFSPALAGVLGLVQGFGALASVLGQGLAAAYQKVLLPLAKWLAELLVPAGLGLLAAGLEFLASACQALQPLASWLYEAFLQPLGQWAGDVVIGALQTLTAALQKMSDWAEDHREGVALMAQVVLGFLAGLWVYNTGKNVAAFIAGPLCGALAKLAGLFSFTALQGGAAAVGVAALMTAVIQIAKHWGDMSGLERMISVLGALAMAAGVAAVAMGAVKGAAGAAVAALAIGAGVVAVAGAIHAAKARSAAYAPAGMPMLAAGAVVPPNAPFAAILGDNKNEPEIVSPLSTMRQAAKEALLDVLGGTGGQTVVLELDGRQFARAVAPYAQAEQRRTGVCISSVG